jgi:hypothetical protein
VKENSYAENLDVNCNVLAITFAGSTAKAKVDLLSAYANLEGFPKVQQEKC